MTLAQVRLAPLPRDGAALEFSVKRTLLGTGVIFRAAFKTSPAALQQWLASSPPLASLAHRGVSTHREARTIPPPQGSPPSTTAEVSIDYDLSAVTVIIRW